MLKQIIDEFGADAQKQMAVEEMAELIKEICKDFRGKGNKEAITEEIADVMVMLDQLMLIYDIKLSDVHGVMNAKIERTLKRIKKGRKDEGAA